MLYFKKKQNISLEKDKKILKKEFQILKPSYSKNNNKKKVE